MADPLRIGIVGCGEVAQLIHLPSLRRLPDQFRVTALCDVSQKVVQGVGEQWNVPFRCRHHEELVRRSDVDAVLIANPHLFHKEVAQAAMAAGKHVLLEKPFCLGLDEADALLAAEAASGVTIQVGFMRRYAPAFTEAVKLLPTLGPIRLARVQDVIGQNALIIRHISTVIRGDDLPAGSGEEIRDRMNAEIARIIGSDDPGMLTAYAMLLGLSSHDISAMRELLGLPKRIIAAQQRRQGRSLTATFDYGDYICQFESTVDGTPRFDAHLEVFGDERTLRVQYDTPYVRNLPTRLIVTEPDPAGGYVVRDATSSWEDPFVVEWRAFHDNVTKGQKPKTSLADAREDLVLFKEMIRLMQA